MALEHAPPSRLLQRIAYSVAVAFSSFHLYTGAVGSLPAMQQRSVHLAFAIVLVFLLRAAVSGRIRVRILDVALAILAIGALGYIAVEADALDARAGDYTTLDLAVGVVIIGLVLDVTRRLIGWGLP